MPTTISDYPDGVGTAGPVINRLVDQPIAYKRTYHRNEDGGVDVNVQPCGMRLWILEYEGLSESDVSTLRAHFNAAFGKVNNFEFYHKHDETTYADVVYVNWQIGRHPKKWVQVLTVTLGKLI